jgi:hypothetical protein
MAQQTLWWRVYFQDRSDRRMYGAMEAHGFVEYRHDLADVEHPDWTVRVYPWHRINLVVR